MFLLKILCSLRDLEKCLLINQKNFFATFVDTTLLNGGLNKIIFWDLFFVFCWWFLVYLKSTLNPTFFRASSYSYFAVLNISSLEKCFDSVFLMEFGICFMTFGGWFVKLWMLNISSLDRFFNSLEFALCLVGGLINYEHKEAFG